MTPTAIGADQVSPAELLAAVVTDGPEVGVHVVIDADRARSVETRLGPDRGGVSRCGSPERGRPEGPWPGERVVLGDVPPLRAGQLLIGASPGQRPACPRVHAS